MSTAHVVDTSRRRRRHVSTPQRVTPSTPLTGPRRPPGARRGQRLRDVPARRREGPRPAVPRRAAAPPVLRARAVPGGRHAPVRLLRQAQALDGHAPPRLRAGRLPARRREPEHVRARRGRAGVRAPVRVVRHERPRALGVAQRQRPPAGALRLREEELRERVRHLRRARRGAGRGGDIRRAASVAARARAGARVGRWSSVGSTGRDVRSANASPRRYYAVRGVCFFRTEDEALANWNAGLPLVQVLQISPKEARLVAAPRGGAPPSPSPPPSLPPLARDES